MDKLDIADLTEKLAETADMATGLPMSLIMDTWDACDIAGGGYVDRQTWMKALQAAVQAYHDNPVGYTWNEAFPTF